VDRYLLISRVLGLRSSDRAAGVLAAIRAGIVPATEALAFPYTEAALRGWPSEAARTGVRRTAAMVALHKDVRQFTQPADRGEQQRPGHPLGLSLRQLHKQNFGYAAGALDPSTSIPKRNALTMQVDALPLLGLEEAASAISLLVRRCGDEGVVVDFYDIARTLAHWGDGISERSRRTRNRVVQHFYGSLDD
jgi:CRISPR type I-E-associated protein CasB/Cse2